MPIAAWNILIPSLILIIGAVNDLKARKVKNWLSITLAIFAALAAYGLNGLGGLQQGALAFGVAFALGLPLVLARVMGAGDMKLLMAFAIAVEPVSVFWVVVYSFIWGGILGVAQILLKKEGASLFHNITAIVLTRGKGVEQSKLHKIPFTIALFFGWLTQLSLTGFGGLVK